MDRLSLSREQLRSQVSPSFYARGAEYQMQGKVLAAERRRRGYTDIVTGRVRGSASHVYSVYGELDRELDGGVAVDGDCSCPVGYNCKHVVAVLLEELRDGSRVQPALPGPVHAPAQPPIKPRAVHSWASRLAVEDQATDRAHRIGQAKKVFVYRLITAGTVEQKMLALQASTRRLAGAVLTAAGAAGGARLGAAELEQLLEPLA